MILDWQSHLLKMHKLNVLQTFQEFFFSIRCKTNVCPDDLWNWSQSISIRFFSNLQLYDNTSVCFCLQRTRPLIKYHRSLQVCHSQYQKKTSALLKRVSWGQAVDQPMISQIRHKAKLAESYVNDLRHISFLNHIQLKSSGLLPK